MKYLLCLLCGCAMPWTLKYDPLPMVWVPVSPSRLIQLCGPGTIACADRDYFTKTCRVYSTMTEAEARTSFMLFRVDVREHEKRHCDGEEHG